MRVYKDTTFELSMMPWELEPPRTTLMLVAKATFALGDEGPCTIADEQVPCLGEVPWEDGEAPSLRTETDYAIVKPTGEWYLTGSAFSAGAPVTILPVNARVGNLHKRLVVWGDRVWARGVLGAKPTEPAPFTSVPLRWERCAGGPNIPENPLGCGARAIETERGVVEPLPNIEDPGHPVLARDDRLVPAGMFAIPCMWRSRVQLTGTYDAIWKASRWPYFPRDFDFTFFNCAPPDQRLPSGFWRGDEAIELTGLHPQRPRLRTRLPGLRARVFVEWATPRAPDATPLELLTRAELEALGRPKLQDVPLQLDTIVIDTDAGHVMCQWRGLVDVGDYRLTNVARIFALHEPLDANRPIESYEQALLDKLLEEADEFELEAPPVAVPALAAPAVEGPPDVPDPALPPPELDAAFTAYQRDFVAFVQALAPPEGPPPDTAAVRAQYEKLGLDPELIPEPVLPEVEPDEPPSYRRFVALVRRRIGKSFADLDLSDAPFRNLDLSGVDFTGAVLTGADLSGTNLTSSTFDGATLARANLDRANATKATFRGADLTEISAVDANFEVACLDDAAGSSAVLIRAMFRGASMVGTELEDCDMTHCDLRDANLDGADFVGSVLDEAGFVGSSLVDTSLEGVHAHGAVFDRCRMPDLRASDGADLTRARFILVDGPRMQLQGAILTDANFSGSNLEEADLSDASAERLNVMRSVLKSAKLDRAILREAVFIQANLMEASMEGADLSGADARGANLYCAYLYRARTAGMLLDGANLELTNLGASGQS